MFRTSEAPEIEQALTRSREGNTHAVEEVDDRRGHLAHGSRGWLVRKEVAPIYGVVKVLPRRVAFAFGIEAPAKAVR